MNPKLLEQMAEQSRTRTFFLTEVQDELVARALADLPYLQMMTVYLMVWRQWTLKAISDHLAIPTKEVRELWDESLATLGGSLLACLRPEPESG